MPSKKELQTILSEEYGINKNISQPLTSDDCERLLQLLRHQPVAQKLAESYALRNLELSNRNRHFGQLRFHAEKKLSVLKQEHEEIERAIANLESMNTDLENSKQELETRKRQLIAEQNKLDAEIKKLAERNKILDSEVKNLTTVNDELVEANTQLKKDNKDLKNIVDQIRLRLAKDMNELLQYEDNQIRRAMIRLFRWTLG